MQHGRVHEIGAAAKQSMKQHKSFHDMVHAKARGLRCYLWNVVYEIRVLDIRNVAKTQLMKDLIVRAS